MQITPMAIGSVGLQTYRHERKLDCLQAFTSQLVEGCRRLLLPGLRSSIRGREPCL